MELINERYALAAERIALIPEENYLRPELSEYFHKTAEFLQLVSQEYDKKAAGKISEGRLEDLRDDIDRLYSDIMPDNYMQSYACPDYAVEMLGEDFGRILSALYYELRTAIAFAYEGNLNELVIRMELFLEIYGEFTAAAQGNDSLPEYTRIKQTFYSFFSDYAVDERILRFSQIVDPVEDYARELIMNSDLSDITYLYRFGEYIAQSNIDTALYLDSLPEEKIKLMADTFTNGYIKGFETSGKDISIKKTVSVRYQLGFERVIRQAILNFSAQGLQSSVYRALPGIFFNDNSTYRNGYTGASCNKQYDYDHKDDIGLFADSAYFNRKTEAVRAACEEYKDKAAVFGGPAVMEVFGEKVFTPASSAGAVHLTAAQSHDLATQKVQSSLIQNQYIHGDERSFTIISFPVSSIGKDYEKIFDDTVRLNTLDYILYRDIQQKIINVLDKAEYVHIRGMNANHTDMRVQLHRLEDPEHETNFENCVADVNIPVGEVFTSPVLKGTEGILHVTGVFLEGLFFKNLEITFKDGCIVGYSCSNFEADKENKQYIDENILFHHKTLPLGEFAIGTNTTAYRMARKYGIEDRMPILIAEKTGPHFAVGDTCYSYDEDNTSYNPDGKRIIARENEISALRKTEPSKAYFSCHTDITIPYDELGEVTAVGSDGMDYQIISNGRFVLEGTGALNEPLDDMN